MAIRRSCPIPLGINQIIAQNLGSVIYGGIDGIITIFALVSGSNGANLSIGLMIIIGLASIFADAISMGTSDYMSQMAEIEMHKNANGQLLADCRLGMETELQNDLEIFLHNRMLPNFTDKEVTILSCLLIRDPELVRHTLAVTDIMEQGYSALQSAVITFCSFIVFGLVPLMGIIFSSLFIGPFLSSCICTLSTLFALGCFKAQFTQQNPIKSGLQMALLGGSSASVAYFVATFLSSLGISQ